MWGTIEHGAVWVGAIIIWCGVVSLIQATREAVRSAIRLNGLQSTLAERKLAALDGDPVTDTTVYGHDPLPGSGPNPEERFVAAYRDTLPHGKVR